MKVGLIYKEESYEILGACFEVYKERGCGLLEAVYQECLEIEFGLCKIPFSSQAALTLYYKGQQLKQKYVPDFDVLIRLSLSLKLLRNYVMNTVRKCLITFEQPGTNLACSSTLVITLNLNTSE